jgi:HD-like signal output (HDOD) protein
VKEVRYANVNLLRVAQSFPGSPAIMARLGQVLRNPHCQLGEIAAHVKQDTTLAARLLRIANSAAFAQSEPVASIEDAAALIGLADLHRLVGAVAVDHFSLRNYPLYGFTGPQLRANALFGALLMEELAHAAKEDMAAAYSAGLFRSLGKLALATIVDEAAPVAPFRPETGEPLVAWERYTFGRTSNDATAAILHEWHFPADVTQAIAAHYDPTADTGPLAALLNLAGHLAEQAGHGLPGETPYWLAAEAAGRATGLGPRHCQRAVERAGVTFERINRAVAPGGHERAA